MNNTPVLLHDHNEFLNEKIFLRGIEIYCEIISSLANVKMTLWYCAYQMCFYEWDLTKEIYWISSLLESLFY